LGFRVAGPGARKQERAVSEGFHASGKEHFALLVASDFDPEGFELADDAIRSLRACGACPSITFASPSRATFVFCF
jgi:hypothetical protein